jgi:hypothetical protein
MTHRATDEAPVTAAPADDALALCLSNSLAPGLVRHGTPEQYESAFERTRKAERAEAQALVDAAEPYVEALEKRLNRGFSVVRFRSESGVHGDDMKHLLSRTLPREYGANSGWEPRHLTAALEKLKRWLEDAYSAQTAPVKFAETPTMVGIVDLCLAAHKRKTLTVIVGGFGIGKTCAAECAVDMQPRKFNSPGCVRIEISESDRTISQLLRGIFFRLVNREPYAMGDEAMAELCKVLRPGDVVILDECQRLANVAKGRGSEAVRELFDRSAASIVLLGNEALSRSGNLLDPKLYNALQSRARVFPTQFLYTSEDDIDEYILWRGLAGSVALRKRLVRLYARRPPGHRVGNKDPQGWVPGGLRRLARVVDTVAAENGIDTPTPEMLLDHLDSLELK